jgi:hypothetical protein
VTGLGRLVEVGGEDLDDNDAFAVVGLGDEAGVGRVVAADADGGQDTLGRGDPGLPLGTVGEVGRVARAACEDQLVDAGLALLRPHRAGVVALDVEELGHLAGGGRCRGGRRRVLGLATSPAEQAGGGGAEPGAAEAAERSTTRLRHAGEVLGEGVEAARVHGVLHSNGGVTRPYRRGRHRHTVAKATRSVKRRNPRAPRTPEGGTDAVSVTPTGHPGSRPLRTGSRRRVSRPKAISPPPAP